MRTANDRPCVLITGNNGFSGRHLARYARELDLPHRLVGLDLRQDRDDLVDEPIVGSLHDLHLIREILADFRPIIVIHLAGSVPPATDAELWAANVDGTVNLLESLKLAKSDARVLVVGSAAEYGPAQAEKIAESHDCRPASAYGGAKLAQTRLCERYAREFRLPIVVARAFNLYGPGMPPRTVIGELCRQVADAEDGDAIELGNVASARDFIDIRDAVSAYWLLARRGAPGEIYNVCTGHATSVADIAAMVIAQSGKHLELRSHPDRFNTDDFQRSCGDNAKIREHVGWQPRIVLEKGLRDTLESLQRIKRLSPVEARIRN